MSLTDEIGAATRAVALRDVELTTTMRLSTTPTRACRGAQTRADHVQSTCNSTQKAFRQSQARQAATRSQNRSNAPSPTRMAPRASERPRVMKPKSPSQDQAAAGIVAQRVSR